MKHIGILEYTYHSIYFATLAKITNTPTTKVTLCTTEEIYHRILPHLPNINDYHCILKNKTESINSFLKRVETYCNKHIDLLFVNTIQESLKDLPHHLAFNPNCKKILTIHDVNTWLKPKPQFDLIRPLRTLDTLMSTLLIQHNILPKYTAINVVYPPLKDYVECNTTYDKPIFTLPFMLYNPDKKTKQTKQTKQIHFVVPGEIINTRRDHQTILTVFTSLFKKYKQRINLTLLGRPRGNYGATILNHAETLKKQGYNITYYKEFVPETLYDETLQNADVIIAPVKLQTTSLGTIKEIFGQTKASGAPYEAIQYAKPLIIPNGFNMVKELTNSILPYASEEDLQQHLTKLITNPKKLATIKKNAQKNAAIFSLKTQQKYFQEHILNKI